MNYKIFNSFCLGLSNRQIAKILQTSEHCIRLRLDRMSRQALLFHSEMTKNLRIREDIAFDGLQNFSGSQYNPNNIQQAIGSDSLFIYDFNFVPLNRSGKMSEWQKKRLRSIEADQGRYNPSSIRIGTQEIFDRLINKSENNTITLKTDEHFQYKRAIQHIKSEKSGVTHQTVSSKECRNFQNILFPVNHADLMIRHKIGAFRRETISFAKTAGRMVQKYILFAVEKNYLLSQFSKKQKRRPHANLNSPAQIAGITNKLFKFSDVFHQYPREEDSKTLNREWQHYWKGSIPDQYQRNLKHNKSRNHRLMKSTRQPHFASHS